jgi:hypothetical protein
MDAGLLIAAQHSPCAGQQGRFPLGSRGSSPDPETIVKKAKPLPHRNRSKTGRYRAKLKAKHRRVRLRRSKGERGTYR